uniref:Glycosyltransferase n=1 Tax=Eustoma russellianum TaxID=52518 RepID=A4F1Q3_EUSRU|nr:anthocyanin 5-O-glucosyltransferase [Eustoma grandiflorum]BAF49287.1 anthocyanin 5-O-glucosyltransferase [Eustoma grandiflorum]
MSTPHILLVVFPAQGHISPALQLAMKLVAQGIQLTFLTSSFAEARMSKPTNISGLNFVYFPEVTKGKDYMFELRKHGSQTLKDIILSSINVGLPISRILYTTLLPWAADIARESHIPSILLWTQPVTTLVTFHYYFNGYEDVIKNICNHENSTLQLPRLPLLSRRDLHSFLLPSNPYKGVLRTFKDHLDALDMDENPTVLVNSFNALEEEALKAITKYKMVGVGPLVPSSIFNTKNNSEDSLSSNLWQKSIDCTGWLDSKPHGSIIYVSFGSHVKQSMTQMKEIAKGLLASGKAFLWVITSNNDETVKNQEDGIEILNNMMEELEEKGMIVPWCAQLEVLKHPSIGCFLTHCGWNSTLESMVCGVPMVCFPKMFDQGTISKLVVDVWKVGVRVDENEDGIVCQEEIKKCIDHVMDGGKFAQELGENARKWMSLGKEAVLEGGSSYYNLKAFVEEIKGGSSAFD